jgi:uncharacterized protein (TIGR03790 family)
MFRRILTMKYIFSALVLLGCAGAPVMADNPGDEVILVYNKRVPESKGLAEYYAEKRQVPTNQIFGFELSTNEDITRMEFRDALQKPLARTLEEKKLWHIASQFVRTTNGPSHVEWRVVQSRIRYAVLCYGVPLRIMKDPFLKEEGTETLRPEMRRNEAAVDNELALLPVIEQGLPLAGPLRNPVHSATNPAWFDPTNGVLMVARLDGPTVGIARGLVDKALEAEKNGLWGRAYFDLRNISEAGFKMGDDWIRAAAELSRHLGFETRVDEASETFPASFPMSQIALYAGWYSEHADGPFAEPTVEFMPGAFAYHIHSYSAATLRSTTRNWVGPLLAKGATITMGSVDEPYLSGTPDVATFISRLVFHGLTFGEAAYASQSVLSWQTTVVGDPLYRPFGTNPEALHVALEQRHSKLLEWSYLRLANINLANGKPVTDWVDFLEALELTKQSAVLTEKLSDLYAAQGKPSSAVHAGLKALKLNPSPQQRIRLRLTLGERLMALNREQEAYDEYSQLLKESPNYPGKTNVIARISELAQKLRKPAGQ